MKYDSWASLSARTFASHCFGHEPKARVAIGYALKTFQLFEKYYINVGFDLIVDLDMNSNDFHFMMNSKHNISNMHKT
jgi:hypothetical protein